MYSIVLEGVALAAMIVAIATLLFAAVAATPWGRRLRHARNRRRLERGQPFRCAIHGPVADGDLVLTRHGERMCPRCYAEIIND
jgi:hypothetical protein